MLKKPQLLSLAVLIAACTTLVTIRVLFTGYGTFRFMLWNLGLAIIPLLSMYLANRLDTQGRKLPAVAAALLAVLFLPNAPYMITDLMHLRSSTAAPVWYDTLMMFPFAAAGVALFYLTLFQLEEMLHRHFTGQVSVSAVFLVIQLSAFGVYLGRYMRFNSWDIVSDPGGLFAEIVHRFVQPFEHPRTWAMTLGYGFLLTVGYLLLKLNVKKPERLEKQLG